jgi:ABC-type bacteriocin/lantibiotic exporter with double-glycine peptidase domain
MGEIVFKNFNGFWKAEELENPSLRNINLDVKPGQLIGVTGKVGSGKSGLLGVILE